MIDLEGLSHVVLYFIASIGKEDSCASSRL